MEGIYQQAAQGNVQIAAQLLQNMGKENVDLNEVVNKLLEDLKPEEQALPEGAAPGGPPQGGLPQGGLPQGGQLPPEAASLPSLGALGIGG